MNYSGYYKSDMANGEGWRVTLFVSGCSNHCKGCQNLEAQDYNYGKLYTDETQEKILKDLNRKNIQGLSLSGGDPLWQDENGLNKLINLCKETHKLGKDIWMWTGFTWEEIFNSELNKSEIQLCRELIRNCDILIDGRFEEDKKDLSLAWRGSYNQRIIDVNKSIKEGEVVLYDKYK